MEIMSDCNSGAGTWILTFRSREYNSLTIICYMYTAWLDSPFKRDIECMNRVLYLFFDVKIDATLIYQTNAQVQFYFHPMSP